MRPLLGLVLLAASRAAHDATDVAKMYEAMRASVDAYGDRYGGQPTADWNASDPRGSASRFLRPLYLPSARPTSEYTVGMHT